MKVQSVHMNFHESSGSHESVGHDQGGAAEGDARCEAGHDSTMSGRAWGLMKCVFAADINLSILIIQH